MIFAFDCFGTIFDASTVPAEDVQYYVTQVKRGITPLTVPPSFSKMKARALQTYFGIVVTDDNEADAIGILLAAQMGPPPESKKQAVKRVRKAMKRERKLF